MKDQNFRSMVMRIGDKNQGKILSKSFDFLNFQNT
jgi:hypothetical protein